MLYRSIKKLSLSLAFIAAAAASALAQVAQTPPPRPDAPPPDSFRVEAARRQAPQVLTIVHRLDGLKALVLLRRMGETVSTVDDELLTAANKDPLALWGLLFHQHASGSGKALQNGSLRPLDQSWRLAADYKDELIVVARVEAANGLAEELMTRPNSPSPTKLWMKDVPGTGGRVLPPRLGSPVLPPRRAPENTAHRPNCAPTSGRCAVVSRLS